MSGVSNYEIDWSRGLPYWLGQGEKLERYFCEKICPQYDINAEINPEKEKNPIVPDLLIGGKTLGELKHKESPFFRCSQYGNFDPRTTISLDKISIDYYRREYRELLIYIYVNWAYHKSFGVEIKPLTGLWLTSTQLLEALIKTGRSYLHTQQDRSMMNDDNTKDVYLFSLDDFKYQIPLIYRDNKK